MDEIRWCLTRLKAIDVKNKAVQHQVITFWQISFVFFQVFSNETRGSGDGLDVRQRYSNMVAAVRFAVFQ